MRNRFILGLLFTACIGYGFFEMRGSHGVSALQQRTQEVRALEQNNQQLRREIQDKQNRISRLRSNPDEQELEIRRRLKLVKPGEQVYILQDKLAPR